MVKKLVCLLSVFVVGISQGAFAAPSVKMLGNSKLSSTSVKPVANVSSRRADNKASIKPTAAKIAKVAKTTPVTTAMPSVAAQGRIPAISRIKSIPTAKTKPVVVSDGGTKTAVPSVTEDDLNEVVEKLENLKTQNESDITDVVEKIETLRTQNESDITDVVERIETLETKSENIITGVVENQAGNYVTDVAVSGDKINVHKTSSLYAPVRDSDSGNVSGNAEIWVERHVN